MKNRKVDMEGREMQMEKMKQLIKNYLNEFNVEVYKIILFGSRARGDYNESSDWDLLIVVNEIKNPSDKKRIWKLVYEILHSHFPDSSFDIIIRSKEEFDIESNMVNTVCNEAIREGIAL